MAYQSHLSREEAWKLFTTYNKDPFHIQHSLTLEAVMKWFAKELGYESEADFWSIVGLLHDIDFEQFPDEHCVKCRELLSAGGVNEEVINSICCHGWSLIPACHKPEHLMEKVLFAVDELTGLIWAAAIIRPSKSVMDMELKSLKKKFKTLSFAAGCNREVIEKGAALLEWELDTLFEKTLNAMRACEEEVNAFMAAYRN
ncbi:MAG: hydrolase [Treponema sp.]|nr:hydrolase [Treponema sp.]